MADDRSQEPDMDKREYETPEIDAIGSVAELTEQLFNKFGAQPDGNGQVTGVLTSL